MSLPTLEQWQTQVLRVSVFSPNAINHTDIYQLITGAQPEMQTRHPQLNQTIETGTIGNDRLEIRTSLNRLDILLTPASISHEIGFPSIGNLNSALKTLEKFQENFLTLLKSIETIRIALGSVNFLIEKDLQAANEVFASHMPSFKIDAKNATDLMVQINYPKPSNSINELQINRLTKRSCVTIKTIDFSAPNGASNSIKDIHAFQIETDINTSPDWNRAFKHDELHKIYNELINSTIETIQYGG